MLISSLMEAVRSSWTWTKERYPKLDLSARSKRGHVLLHLAKALGALSAEEERVDHGRPMDREAYRTAIAKLMIDAAQLADLESISPDELAVEIKKILAASNM